MNSEAYEEKVQLLGGRADAVCEEQGIALEPGDLLGGELVAGAGTRHADSSSTYIVNVLDVEFERWNGRVLKVSVEWYAGTTGLGCGEPQAELPVTARLVSHHLRPMSENTLHALHSSMSTEDQGIDPIDMKFRTP